MGRAREKQDGLAKGEKKCYAVWERGVGMRHLVLVSKSERYLEKMSSNADC